MKIGLVTFASGDPIWRLASLRLRKQAKSTKRFTTIKVYTRHSVSKLADPSDLRFINSCSKGHGLWLWKPIIILDFLKKNPEIDIILYLDAGCEIRSNDKALEVLDHYFGLLADFQAVVFSMQHTEKLWSKKILVDELLPSPEILDSGQILGGIHLMRREFSLDFCNEWIRIMKMQDYRFLKSDLELETLNFKAHRHDQSIFSILIKQRENIKILESENEVYFSPSWKTGEGKPLWTSRKKSLVPSEGPFKFSKAIIFAERVISRIYRGLLSKTRKT